MSVFASGWKFQNPPEQSVGGGVVYKAHGIGARERLPNSNIVVPDLSAISVDELLRLQQAHFLDPLLKSEGMTENKLVSFPYVPLYCGISLLPGFPA